jgi:hyperosmotically inducible protein
MKRISQLVGRTAGAAFLVVALSTSTVAGLEARPQTKPAPAPDNTKVNTRDRQPSQVTADQQKNNKTDLDITKEIRKALVADKSLSSYAHNVKVITRNGKVTLKGPVRSEDEKKMVEAKAAEVAGATNITNQISVAPEKEKKPAKTS